MKPITPQPAVTAVARSTKPLLMSDHSTVGMISVKRIRLPPMVGVPRLEKCDLGPSSRTTWPSWIFCRVRMNQGYRTSDRTSAVSVAARIRVEV
jgi:hypothetical protein